MNDIKLAISRLTTLADYLKNNVVPTQFNLRYWVRFEDGIEIGESHADTLQVIQQNKEVDCGTTACACGWAATIPEFNKLGFELVPMNEDSEDNDRYSTIAFGNNFGYYGVREFFNITIDQAYYLFSSTEYPRNNDGLEFVVERIENFVNQMKEQIRE